ncbi:MAG: DUF2510 domain-containing protein [Acidimicrobiales bacterium]
MNQPAGWYVDSAEPSRLRYWDGDCWTDETKPLTDPGLREADMRNLVTTTQQAEQAKPAAGMRHEPSARFAAEWLMPALPSIMRRGIAPSIDTAILLG